MIEEIPPSQIRFLAKPGVWDYLNNMDMPIDHLSLLRRAFRTRCRMDGDLMDFQFRFSPESFWENEMEQIETIRLSLVGKLQGKLLDRQVLVTLKISSCCGKDCFGCEIYGRSDIQ